MRAKQSTNARKPKLTIKKTKKPVNKQAKMNKDYDEILAIIENVKDGLGHTQNFINAIQREIDDLENMLILINPRF